MSEQLLTVVSIISLFLSLGAIILAVKTVSKLGEKYADFVESHISSIRAEIKKTQRETMQKLSIATDEIRKGGTASRDLKDSVKLLQEESARQRKSVDIIEERLGPDKRPGQMAAKKKSSAPPAA